MHTPAALPAATHTAMPQRHAHPSHAHTRTGSLVAATAASLVAASVSAACHGASETPTHTPGYNNAAAAAAAAGNNPARKTPTAAAAADAGGALRPRVLVPMRGSGNYGESGQSAYYTYDRLPAPLTGMDADPPRLRQRPLVRHDVGEVGEDRLAFYVDDVLSAEEAGALAACADSILEANGGSRIAPGINTPPGMRVNMAAHWYPAGPGANRFTRALLARVRHLVPQTLGGLPLHQRGLSEKVAQFKYEGGDRFERHVDGLFPGSGCNEAGDGLDEWVGVQSGMSILFYLNGAEEGVVGGETRLWSADGSRFADVRPKKGRALFFRRGSPDAVLHAGLPVQPGSTPKTIALINLLYGERTGTAPLQ